MKKAVALVWIWLLVGSIVGVQVKGENTWTPDLLSKPYWTKTLQRTFIGDVVLSENTGQIYISSISLSAIYLTAVDFYGNIIWDIKLRELPSVQMLDADLSLHISSNGQYVVISPRILGKDMRVYKLGTYIVDIHGNIVKEFSETYSIQGVFNDGSILISDGVLKKIDISGQIVTEFVGTKAYVSSESVIGIEDSNVLYFMSLGGNILHRHQIEGFITDVKIFDKYVLVATQNFQVETYFGMSGTRVRFSRGPIRSRIYLFSLRGEPIYTSQELRGVFNAGAIKGDTLLLAMAYGDILEQESGTSGRWVELNSAYYYRINIKSGEAKESLYNSASLPVLCVVFPKENSKNTAVITSPTSLSVLKIDSMSISTTTNVPSRKTCSSSLIISFQKTTLSAYLLVAPSMLGHSSLESSTTPEKEELTSTFTPKYEEYNVQIDGVKGHWCYSTAGGIIEGKFDRDTHSGIAMGLDMTPDGKYIAIGDKEGNFFLVTRDGKLLWTKKLDAPVRGISFYYDPNDEEDATIAVAVSESISKPRGKVYLFTLNGELIDTIDVPHFIKDIKYGDNWDHILLLVEPLAPEIEIPGVVVYVYDSEESKWREYRLESEGFAIMDMSLTSDRKYVVLGVIDGTILIVDYHTDLAEKKQWGGQTTGKILKDLKISLDENAGLYGIAASNDAEYIVIGDSLGKIYLYTKEGNLLWKKLPARCDAVDMAITPGGSYILAGGCNTYLLDREGNLPIKNIIGRSLRVAMSADGKYFVVGTSTRVCLFENTMTSADQKTFYDNLSPETQKKLANYAIQKTEELIQDVKELNYEINFATEVLQQAKDSFNKGDYKNARDLARRAWLVALQEWQIQYEAEILEKVGINVDSPLQQYKSGNIDGALNLLNHLSSQLSGAQKAFFDSVHSTFEIIKEYWNDGILLYNAVDGLIESNKEFKKGNIDKAKNLADSALKTAKDLGKTAREIKKKLEEVARAIYEEGRGDEKAKEFFERAVELFERGDFEKAQEVLEEVIVIVQKGESRNNTALIIVALLIITGVVGVAFVKRR